MYSAYVCIKVLEFSSDKKIARLLPRPTGLLKNQSYQLLLLQVRRPVWHDKNEGAQLSTGHNLLLVRETNHGIQDVSTLFSRQSIIVATQRANLVDISPREQSVNINICLGFHVSCAKWRRPNGIWPAVILVCGVSIKLQNELISLCKFLLSQPNPRKLIPFNRRSLCVLRIWSVDFHMVNITQVFISSAFQLFSFFFFKIFY